MTGAPGKKGPVGTGIGAISRRHRDNGGDNGIPINTDNARAKGAFSRHVSYSGPLPS